MFKGKYIVVIIILLGLGNFTSLKSQINYKQGVLRWEKLRLYDIFSKKDLPYLNFQEGSFRKNEPVAYVEGSEMVSDNKGMPVVKLVSVTYEIIGPEDMEVINRLTDIKDTIEIVATLQTENKQNYVHYSFMPVRRNKITGNYERVINYIIGIEESRLKSVGQLQQTFTYKDNSVLQSGNWYYFKIRKAGVYQIFYNELKDMGLSDPSQVKIFGNGGKMLPEKFTGNKTDDLGEIPVHLVTGADGIFNSGDYLLVYLQGPVTWEWDATNKIFLHSQHNFTDEICYFITEGASGKKISLAQVPAGTVTHQVNTYDQYYFVDNDLNNLITTGREWYGEKFDLQNASNDFYFDLPNLVASENVNVQFEVLARAPIFTTFQFKANNSLFYSTDIPNTNTYNSLDQFAKVNKSQSYFKTTPGRLKLTIQYLNKGEQSAMGWLNYIRLWARQNLKATGLSQLEFRDTYSLGNGNIADFSIDGASNQILVWDITDFHDVKQLNTTLTGTKLSFVASTSTLRNYIAFDYRSGLQRPVLNSENKVANQNLHAASNLNFVIVTHPKFLKQAEELAEIHRKHDGITVGVFTTPQVYNEFSSGNPDVAAIRDFVKMLYDKAPNSNSKPQNLLLFGDGSVNRKILSETNPNYILTYQSLNSLDPTGSYVSDDYYGLLDNNEDVEGGILDIGVGRFPVQDTITAKGVLKKIKFYISQANKGDWRNTLCFIGDDEDNNIHMDQADKLARKVEQENPCFNIDKIYLDAYQQVSTSSGPVYPDAKSAIYNRLNQGALIINYTGHGNNTGFAHEQIVKKNEDIIKWKNTILPLFVTATCEFSQFDDPKEQSAGEEVLLNPVGGGIALLSTSRLVYSGPNFDLNNWFYSYVFNLDSLGKQLTLGEILRKTKNSLVGDKVNKLNFSLLGDPALRLPFTVNKVQTDSINGKDISIADTIHAYQKVTISGSIKDLKGKTIETFNGIVSAVVYDKTKKISSLRNDGGDPFTFFAQKDILYKGQASVKNGLFTLQFVLPRDIDYNFGPGRISFYAKDTVTDASGYFKNVVIGGLYATNDIDGNGPVIKLFINDTTFKNGGITDEFPKLLAHISDNNGINIGGNGIGHDLVATLDENTSDQFILNNYYQTTVDNYNKGEFSYQLPQMTPGLHTLTLKAWDIYNNSSTSQITFRVVDNNSPRIENVKLFPSPWNSGDGPVNIIFEHNLSNVPFEANIQIFNMTGKQVGGVNLPLQTSGYTSGTIPLDIAGFGGEKLHKGIYFIRINIKSDKGQAQSETKKLIIIE